MSSQLIFVTGASGFLGSHIVHQLLEKGYQVRGTARGAKIPFVKEVFASHGDKFDVVSVNDLAEDNIAEHLNGVYAVIHAAAPLPSKGSPQALLNGALNGSLNVIRQAEQAGIKKIVYTSSIVTVMNPKGTMTDEDFNPITEQETLVAAPMLAYIGAKTIAERAVWKFADEHQHVDLTVLNPPYLFGPFVPNFGIPKPDYGALSTNLFIYHFLTKRGRAFPGSPGYADIRDVARIHVESLNSPPDSSVGRKRLPIASPYGNNYKDAVQFIAVAHPELRERLVDADSAPKFPVDKLPVDVKRVEEVTGVKVNSYHTWKDTVLDTVDSLLALEKYWISNGYKVEIPALEEYGF